MSFFIFIVMLFLIFIVMWFRAILCSFSARLVLTWKGKRCFSTAVSSTAVVPAHFQIFQLWLFSGCYQDWYPFNPRTSGPNYLSSCLSGRCIFDDLRYTVSPTPLCCCRHIYSLYNNSPKYLFSLSKIDSILKAKFSWNNNFSKMRIYDIRSLFSEQIT